MSIKTDAALAIVGKALAAGKDQSCSIAAVVTDISGNIVAAARMDGVGHINTEVARKKALAAANFGMPTSDVVEAVSRDPFAKPVVMADPNINILPGGIPIKDGDKTIGALGIAGGHYLQDRAIAEFAMG
ncbi:MAG: heme-binding protein [Sphingomonadaceae bacterium]|nr:heme-binding protein [Sphingomonadaceae bacterium]